MKAIDEENVTGTPKDSQRGDARSDAGVYVLAQDEMKSGINKSGIKSFKSHESTLAGDITESGNLIKTKQTTAGNIFSGNKRTPVNRNEGGSASRLDDDGLGTPISLDKAAFLPLTDALPTDALEQSPNVLEGASSQGAMPKEIEASETSALEIAAPPPIVAKRRSTWSMFNDQILKNIVVNDVKAKGCFLSPNQDFVRRWDIVCAIGLVFTASITPYEIAFLEVTRETLENPDGLFFFNRVVDFIFVFDIVIQFFLTYEVKDPRTTKITVRNHKMIAKRYLKSWFFIDLISIIPFDILGALIESDTMKKFRSLRSLRLLRLIKLVKLMKESRLLERLKRSITFPFAYVSMAKMAIIIMVGAHWAACFFGLAGMMELSSLVDYGLQHEKTSWIYEMANDPGKPWYKGYDDPKKINTEYHAEIYIICLYWAVKTITSIGYGDIVPRGSNEYIASFLLMWALGILWAFCIGSFCGMIATLDPQTAKFQNNMDAVNTMMHHQNLPPDLQRNVRYFFYKSKELIETKRYKTILHMMSPLLQQEVAAISNQKWLRKLWWIHGTSDAFITALACKMSPLMFAAKDTIPTNLTRQVCLQLAPDVSLDSFDTGRVPCMCIISRGLASFCGRVMSQGDVIGVDFLLSSNLLRNELSGLSLTYTEVLCLLRPSFIEVLQDYPEDTKVVRRGTIKLALFRSMKHMIKAKKNNPDYQLSDFCSTNILEQTIGGSEEAHKIANAQEIEQSLVTVKAKLHHLVRMCEMNTNAWSREKTTKQKVVRAFQAHNTSGSQERAQRLKADSSESLTSYQRTSEAQAQAPRGDTAPVGSPETVSNAESLPEDHGPKEQNSGQSQSPSRGARGHSSRSKKDGKKRVQRQQGTSESTARKTSRGSIRFTDHISIKVPKSASQIVLEEEDNLMNVLRAPSRKSMQRTSTSSQSLPSYLASESSQMLAPKKIGAKKPELNKLSTVESLDRLKSYNNGQTPKDKKQGKSEQLQSTLKIPELKRGNPSEIAHQLARFFGCQSILNIPFDGFQREYNSAVMTARTLDANFRTVTIYDAHRCHGRLLEEWRVVQFQAIQGLIEVRYWAKFGMFWRDDLTLQTHPSTGIIIVTHVKNQALRDGGLVVGSRLSRCKLGLASTILENFDLHSLKRTTGPVIFEFVAPKRPSVIEAELQQFDMEDMEKFIEFHRLDADLVQGNPTSGLDRALEVFESTIEALNLGATVGKCSSRRWRSPYGVWRKGMLPTMSISFAATLAMEEGFYVIMKCLKIMSVENRFMTPAPLGWRDILIWVSLEVDDKLWSCELSLSLNFFFSALQDPEMHIVMLEKSINELPSLTDADREAISHEIFHRDQFSRIRSSNFGSRPIDMKAREESEKDREALLLQEKIFVPDQSIWRKCYAFLYYYCIADPWIATDQANYVVGIVIILNVMQIGVETDHRPTDKSPAKGEILEWYTIENIFVVIFIIELILRILHNPTRSFFCSGWNLFDGALAILSIVDTWIITLAFAEISGSGNLMGGMRVLRIFRLLRLVRIVRLFRIFRELGQLIDSLFSSIKGLTWVIVLLSVTCYTFAIFMTIVVGQASDLSDDEFISSRWGGVPESMFTLFVIMTGEGWNDIAIETIERSPYTYGFFIPFVVFTNLIVMNLVVGVIVDKIIISSRDRMAKQEPEYLMKLWELFCLLDIDNSSNISKDELRYSLKSPMIRQLFRDLGIYIGADPEYILREWDSDTDGSLDWEEFVKGATTVKLSEGNRQLMFIQYDLHTYGSAILRKVDVDMSAQETDLREGHEQLKNIIESAIKKSLRKFYEKIAEMMDAPVPPLPGSPSQSAPSRGRMSVQSI